MSSLPWASRLAPMVLLMRSQTRRGEESRTPPFDPSTLRPLDPSTGSGLGAQGMPGLIHSVPRKEGTLGVGQN
jgi:hypothetical protein